MTTAATPPALAIADLLEYLDDSGLHFDGQPLQEAAASELIRLQAELECLRAELEARKPLPLSDAEIIAAQESLARSRARIGLPCSRCESGKYRADSNAYHDFHRCDSCLHVPMWGEDGKEIGRPTCAGEPS